MWSCFNILSRDTIFLGRGWLADLTNGRYAALTERADWHRRRERPIPVSGGGAEMGWRGWGKAGLISAISAACAIAVFAFGIWQYRSSENWKRSEFVAAQIKEFNSDKVNRAVLLMMDYDPVRIELFPEKANVSDRYVNVEFMMLVNAI